MPQGLFRCLLDRGQTRGDGAYGRTDVSGSDDAVFTGAFVVVLPAGLALVESRIAEGDEDGRGHEDGRPGTEDDAHGDGEGEIVDDAAAQEEQGEAGDHGRR